MNRILLTATIATFLSGFAFAQEMSSPQAKSSRPSKTAKPAKVDASANELEKGAKAPRKTSAEVAAEALAAKKKAAQEEVSKLTASQQDKLLELLNEGSEADLGAIKGIASSRSKMIVAARPLKAIEDIVALKGIGKSTFNNVVQHAINIGNKKAEPKS